MAKTEWVKMLPMQLEMISEDELLDDSTPMEEGEIEVGELTLFCKRLETLRRQMLKEMSLLAHKVRFEAKSDEEREQLAKEGVRLSSIKEAVDEIFWLTAREEFDCWEPHVGVRKGWKFVVRTKDDDNPLKDLGKFFRLM